MNAARRTENTTIQLRLAMTTKTDFELEQIMIRRDPANTHRYLNSAALRKAAAVVLETRRRSKPALTVSPLKAPTP